METGTVNVQRVSLGPLTGFAMSLGIAVEEAKCRGVFQDNVFMGLVSPFLTKEQEKETVPTFCMRVNPGDEWKVEDFLMNLLAAHTLACRHAIPSKVTHPEWGEFEVNRIGDVSRLVYPKEGA